MSKHPNLPIDVFVYFCYSRSTPNQSRRRYHNELGSDFLAGGHGGFHGGRGHDGDTGVHLVCGGRPGCSPGGSAGRRTDAAGDGLPGIGDRASVLPAGHRAQAFHPRLTRTNIDSVIGSTGIVITPVNNIAALGQVQINGMEWSARSTNNTHIPAGTLVKVDKIEGVKVFVSPAETPAKV